MKAKLIKRAALAAAILAGGGVAYGDTTVQESALQVVYCKATITNNTANGYVSVTLPPTEGYYDKDGNPLTYWNVGNVPMGGVADSWHGEGGPGRFTARNAGSLGAYLYVMSGQEYVSVPQGNIDPFQNVNADIFGPVSVPMCRPCVSPQELRRACIHDSYHLAFTTDTMAKVPTWHSLDHRNEGGSWSTNEKTAPQVTTVAGYMGYVDAGDYLTFDLKFWAPPRECYPAQGGGLFTFCVEASTFPLWDHGRGIE